MSLPWPYAELISRLQAADGPITWDELIDGLKVGNKLRGTMLRTCVCVIL
jgi:hypothetical protein